MSYDGYLRAQYYRSKFDFDSDQEKQAVDVILTLVGHTDGLDPTSPGVTIEVTVWHTWDRRVADYFDGQGQEYMDPERLSHFADWLAEKGIDGAERVRQLADCDTDVYFDHNW